jgi:putative spermidine/putrescine transport system permease protein
MKFHLRAPRYGGQVLLIAPVTVVVLLFFAPLATMARRSVMSDTGGVTLEHYARFFGDPYYLIGLLVTIGTALLITLITLLVSYPVAYSYWRASRRMRSILVVLLLSPFYANVVVKVFGWMLLLPTDFLNGYAAVIVVSVHRSMPFMVLLLASAMARIEPELLESARVCGAHGGRVFRTVIVPLSVPGVVAGGIVVFSLSVAAYVVPALVGGASRGRFLPVLMYQQITIAQNWGFGAALGIILLTTSIATIAAGNRLVRSAKIGRVMGAGFGE